MIKFTNDLLFMRLFPAVLLLFFLSFSFLVESCKKESLLNSDGILRFSTDTLNFDTVFTEMGSFTKRLKIFNPQDQPIQISSIRLQSGDTSFFKLNVNGVAGNSISDVEIGAKDSIYVFATVKINPRNQSNPFIVEDRLVATLNGNNFSIPFFAYGQDAYYITDSVLAQTDVWKNDKPYVIMHSALIDKGKSLTIPAGCRIYMHADSRLYVRGSLFINGTKTDSVIFQGNRLDRAYFGYQGYPGEWGGIYFDSTSTGSIFKWAVLRNCGNSISGGLPFAIEVFGKSGISSQLKMYNTIIENSLGYGLICFQGNVSAENSMINATGSQALALVQGGKYQFTNCNFINYFPPKLSHYDEPTVAVLNYYQINNTDYWQGDLDAQFINCILYGSMDNEVFCNKKGTASYKLSFQHCFIKSLDNLSSDLIASSELELVNCLLNQDPKFVDYKKFNFRPTSNSPFVHKGETATISSNDLDDVPWNAADTFDIGAYKFKP